MSLLVIVLCLLSERFFSEKQPHHRFQWFTIYARGFSAQLLKAIPNLSAWFVLAMVISPVMLVTGIIYFYLNNFIFGLVGLILNIIIFYCCMGFINPFYPVIVNDSDTEESQSIGDYFVSVYEQLFAVLFWYIILGPLSILAYRMIYVCRDLPSVHFKAERLLEWLDWFPSRMTVLLYLIVGNFQPGFKLFRQLFFTHPAQNNELIRICAMAAFSDSESQSLVDAEKRVEHATMVLLVLLAIYTIVIWI